MQNKFISLHSIMHNIKNQKKRRSISYISETQSVQQDTNKIKDELIQNLKKEIESLRQQLCDILQINYENDEKLILHIYSILQQFKKDQCQFQQQDEINNKVIQHYKLLLQQSNDILLSQEEKIQNQEETLIALTNQLKENDLIRSLNTSHQEKQYINQIESLQSQIDNYRNVSQSINLDQFYKLKSTLKLQSNNQEEIEDEILQFVIDTLQFYQAIGNQQIFSFIKTQFVNDQLQLTFNLNQINNEIIKVLINKFDLDSDIEQEMAQLTILKQIRSQNQIFQLIDQIGENVIVKLQNYKRNEISRVMLIQNLVNLKKQILKKI